MRTTAAFAAALAMSFGPAAYAGTTGVLSGRVIDVETSQPLASARVIVYRDFCPAPHQCTLYPAERRSPYEDVVGTTGTDARGFFVFVSLRPGSYHVIALCPYCNYLPPTPPPGVRGIFVGPSFGSIQVCPREVAIAADETTIVTLALELRLIDPSNSACPLRPVSQPSG